MRNFVAPGLLTIAALICFGFGMDLAEGAVSGNVNPGAVSGASLQAPP